MEIKLISADEQRWLVEPVNSTAKFGIDILWIETLDKFFQQDFGREINAICIKFDNVTHIDSSALRQLIQYSTSLGEAGIDLQLSGLNEHIIRILRITRLIEKLTILNSKI